MSPIIPDDPHDDYADDDLPFGFKMKIDDGSGPTTIFVNTQTGIDTSTLHEGDLIKVIGFSSQFEDHWEIDPRRPSDIIKPEL
jgi:DNA/RNA endonuclease YhcR with UshA esterase domain